MRISDWSSDVLFRSQRQGREHSRRRREHRRNLVQPARAVPTGPELCNGDAVWRPGPACALQRELPAGGGAVPPHAPVRLLPVDRPGRRLLRLACRVHISSPSSCFIVFSFSLFSFFPFSFLYFIF